MQLQFFILCIEILYGMKYWWGLYLADSLFFAFPPRLANFNLAESQHVHSKLVKFKFGSSLVQPPIRQIKFSVNISCHTVYMVIVMYTVSMANDWDMLYYSMPICVDFHCIAQ